MMNRRSVLLSAAALAGTAVARRSAHANEEIRVGVLSPMTGPAARFGAIQQSTLNLAIEDVNGAGGIRSLGGAKISLIFGDTRGEADMGVTETERLITRERVHALIGAFQSGVGLPSLRRRGALRGAVAEFRHRGPHHPARLPLRFPPACQRHAQGTRAGRRHY